MALPYIIGSTVFSILGGISLKMYNNNNSHTINTTNLNDSIDYSLVDYNLKEITVSSNKSPSLGITFAQKCQAITNLCKSKCGFDPNHKYTKNNRQKLMRYIKEYERIGLNQFIKNHKKKNYLEK
tara:strand:- start:155 stop:529 length:375 start_codon:yes stop_codon:yes gene_type:complete